LKLNEYFSDLDRAFEEAKNPTDAVYMEAYMRNKFRFLGIRAPLRKTLAKPFFLKSIRPPESSLKECVSVLWKSPWREMQFVGMELASKYKNELDAGYFELFEFMIVNKSWWDTVDYIAATLVGNLFLRFPEEGFRYIEKWRKSKNIWLIRTCIIFQLKYKEKIDEALLFSLIIENRQQNDFFIRKAIGWSLRQYAKTNPQRVIEFVKKSDISGLSKREALKNLN